jgi:predicted nucleic acid-binding protein
MPDGRLLDTSVLIPLLRGEPGLRDRYAEIGRELEALGQRVPQND